MKSIIYTICLIILTASCRKDDIIVLSNTQCKTPIIPCVGSYNKYSTANFDFIKIGMANGAPIDPSSQYLNKYGYRSCVFNPNNSDEIAYIRSNNETGSFEKEVWTYNFCTNESKMIHQKAYYGIDWGNNDWIIFTGNGYRIYKIKSNGDSLQMLSQLSNHNNVGKFNSSGNLYWNSNDGIRIENINGGTYKIMNTPMTPSNWMNDTTIIARSNGKLCSVTLDNEIVTVLNETDISDFGETFITPNNKYAYISKPNGLGQKHYFLRYDLMGFNTLDTISIMYDSYRYISGDIMNKKLLIRLGRTNWKNDNPISNIYQNRVNYKGIDTIYYDVIYQNN